MKVGIVNVTGYAGAELARILHQHPETQIVSVTGRTSAGRPLGEVFPHLEPVNLTITEEVTESVDIIFSALPHAASAEKLGPYLEAGVKAIDISADYRLDDISEYEEWYGIQHPYPQYIRNAVYGLPELHRSGIQSATLVANPGCYPTASILALAPAVQENLIGTDVIVDAKSGVSGAGRKAEIQYLYNEVNESLRAYSLSGHRHLPEITQELCKLRTSEPPMVTFVPHLIPMTRGILASCYATTKEDITENDLQTLYKEYYSGHPFVKVVDDPPSTKQTLGSNNCLIYPTLDQRTNRLIVISCIDNLIKGAAGQAVQNMNLMLGYSEDSGLNQIAIYP
tara:strand:- start:1607 stop:2623 length:1017 start_codon:yes stop_codon:yes gene_type:complete